MKGKNIFNSMGKLPQDLVEEAAGEYKPPLKRIVCKISITAASIALLVGIVFLVGYFNPNLFRGVTQGTSGNGLTGDVDEEYADGPTEIIDDYAGGGADVEYTFNDVTYIGRKYIWELPEDAEYVDSVVRHRDYYGYVEAYIYRDASTPEVLYWKWNADSVDETWGKVWNRVWILEDEKEYE